MGFASDELGPHFDNLRRRSVLRPQDEHRLVRCRLAQTALAAVGPGNLDIAEQNGCLADKVAEARELAEKMRAWPTRKNPD